MDHNNQFLTELFDKDFEFISNFCDQIIKSDNSVSYLLAGLLYEYYDQHHLAVNSYEKAITYNPTLIAKLSLCRATLKISHWRTAMERFKEFSKMEFHDILQIFHHSFVYAHLPPELQIELLDHYELDIYNEFALISIGQETKIEKDSNTILSHFRDLFQGAHVSQALAYLESEVRWDDIEIHPGDATSVRSDLLDIVTNTKVRILQKFDLFDGWLTGIEGRILYHLAKEVNKNSTIVEIGGWLGKSSCFLGQGSKDGNLSEVYSIDPHLWTDHIDRENTFNRWHDTVKQVGLEKYVTNIRSTSHSASKYWKRDIGLLFVDGDHSSPAVRQDIHDWTPYLEDGAFIVFHDSFFEEVFRVLEDCIWSDLRFRIIDVVDGMLIVRYLKHLDRSGRSYCEKVLWIYLRYRTENISQFLKQSRNEIRKQVYKIIEQNKINF